MSANCLDENKRVLKSGPVKGCKCDECVRRRKRNYAKLCKWRAENPEKVREHSRKSDRKRYAKASTRETRRVKNVKYRLKHLNTIEGYLSNTLRAAKSRAKNRGELFDLTIEQLTFIWNEQGGRCALTGVEMTWGSGDGWKPTSASLDRIDSSEIYIKGNVRFLCDIINIMKFNLTDEELKEWCRRVLA